MCSGNEVVNTNNDTMLKIYDYDKIGEDNVIEFSDQYKNEVVNTNNDTMLKIYDYDKIGEDNVIEFTDQYKTDGFVQVIGSDGTTYEKVAADPQAGEFSIAYANNKTTLTFARC